MRVLMNGLPTLKRKTGVGHYVAELHAALARQFPADTFTLTPGDFARGVARRVPRPAGGGSGGPRSPVKSAVAGLVKRAARDAAALHFAAYSRRYPFDLYHETNFVPPPTGLPTVLNVHDLSVLLYPEWHPADRVGHHRRKFLDGLRRADRVLTISDAVKRELVTHCGTDPARVTTIYCGVGPEFRPHTAGELAAARHRLGLPPRYFLSVGTVEPRKNLATLFAAYCDLPDIVRAKVPLLVAGPWGWKSEPVRDFYESFAKERGVRHLGYVADADRPVLYAAATALVYPSFYEGFGLPPAEMLACGGRVIAATAAAVREVCGDAAEYHDPADRDAWRAALLAAAELSEPPAGVVAARVAHAGRYTWDRAAAETRAVYEEVTRAASGRESPSRRR